MFDKFDGSTRLDMGRQRDPMSTSQDGKSRLNAPENESTLVLSVTAVMSSVSGPSVAPYDLGRLIPRRAGIYAILANETARQSLGFEPNIDGPIYVGKAERNLNSRDVKTHFASGKTGWSTVRRSLGALLRNELELTVALRNNTLPPRPANYAFESEGDERLTNWMRANLSLSYWVKEDELNLDALETIVIERLRPELNIDKMRDPFPLVVAARAQIRDEARALAEILTAK